jgi:hypothetical protein
MLTPVEKSWFLAEYMRVAAHTLSSDCHGLFSTDQLSWVGVARPHTGGRIQIQLPKLSVLTQFQSIDGSET